MDLANRLRAVGARASRQTEHLQTEAATSTALVLPLIQALGYDVFDPTEVVPEYTADAGIKRGEKVDYAINIGGEPAILIEVKAWNVELDSTHTSQLFRYFTVTPARLGVLTNGLRYMLFTDLDAPNKMDERPFHTLDIRSLRDPDIDLLRRLSKGDVDLEAISEVASNMKYVDGIKQALAEEFESPSEDLVRLFAKRVYDGSMTKTAREQFAGIVRKALQQFVNDRVVARLQQAIASEGGELEPAVAPAAAPEDADPPEAAATPAVDGDIETTELELEAFRVVRAIMAEVVDPERVVMRDRKTYCGILLDDNNRKPVCRLWFNGTQKYLGTFDEAKNETRLPVESPTDIYRHRDALRAVVSYYDSP